MTATESIVFDNRRALYAFRGLSRLYFHLPILLPFALTLTAGEMGLAGLAIAAYSLAVAGTSLLKVPQSIARRLGPIPTIAISEGGKIVGLLVIAVVPDFAALLVAQIVIGVCFAVGSGADGALPFTYLTGAQRTTAASGLQAIMFVSVIVSAIASGFLFTANVALPFACAAAASAIGIVALLRLRGAPPATQEKSAGPRDSAMNDASRAAVAWWSSYYLLTRVGSMSVYVMLVPASCVIFELAPQAFGLVLGGFGIGGLIAARYGTTIAGRYGYRMLAIVSVVATAVAVGLGALGVVSPALLFINVLLIGLAGGMVRPCTVGGLTAAGIPSSDQGRIAGKLEQHGGLLTAPVVMLFALGLAVGLAPGVLFLCAGGVLLALGLWLLSARGKAAS